MINREIPTQNYITLHDMESLSHNQCEQKLSKSCFAFSEYDFIQWCSQMSSQQLQLNFKVCCPEAVYYMRKNCNQNNKNWAFQICDLQCLNEKMKDIIINTYKKFIQVILLISDKQYLDSITFSRDLFLNPNKVYELLSKCKNISSLLQPYTATSIIFDTEKQITEKNPQSQFIIHNAISLFKEIVFKMQKNIENKMKLKFKHKIKIKNYEKVQTGLYQLNSFWRYCTQEQKQSIWYLGYNDIKKAASKLIQHGCKVDLGLIQQYIQFCQKIGAKQLKDQIFSWKLCRTDNGITSYMQLIFNEICDRLRRNPKQSSKLKNRKQKKRKVKQRLLRRSSIDQSSNQTNQTDITYQHAFDISINQIIQTKIQRNIIELADNINIQANQYYQNRIEAYRRLQSILNMIGIQVQLYGSCCVGLAIKNSDVDVTISQKILNLYYGSLGDTGNQITAFFTYLQYQFSKIPWISNIKIIGSATIPIIKFSIDTRIPITETSNYYYQIPSLDKQQQNQHKKGITQIDLTIETTQPNRKHLGIISTKQTQKWLDQMVSLQSIAIILKNQLAVNMLNQAYYGGLNTYTLLVLIIAVIKKNKLENQNKISIVFQKVLRFYSQEFEQQKYGIDLDSPEIFYLKKLQIGEQQINLKLQVKDPQGDHKIITRNCYQFKKIKLIFAQLYKKHFIQTRLKIQQLCSIWNPKQNPFNQEMLLNWIEKQIGIGLISQSQIQFSNQYFGINEGMRMLKSQ